MTYNEFKTLAGYGPDKKAYYDIIEPMYLHCDTDKVTFCKNLASMGKPYEKKVDAVYVAVKVWDVNCSSVVFYDVYEVIELDITSGKFIVKPDPMYLQRYEVDWDRVIRKFTDRSRIEVRH